MFYLPMNVPELVVSPQDYNIGPVFILMADNVTPYTARVTKNFLAVQNIRGLN